MQQYLLNMKTGIICVDGTNENDIVCECKLIESYHTFKLKGSTINGDLIEATLSKFDYFEGEEFKIEIENNRIIEGHVNLQSHGEQKAITAKNLKVNDIMMWNFGETSKVKSIEFTKSGKSVKIVTEYVTKDGDIKEGDRTFRVDRLVAIHKFASTPEVKEESQEVICESNDQINEVIENENIKFNLNINDDAISSILLVYNGEYINIFKPNKDLIKKSISKIKDCIKMLSSVPSNKNMDRINYEIKNLMSLQTYLILNYGIDEL